MEILHKHHIVPRHMGGTDDPRNFLKCTVEAHAFLHRKLFEAFGCWQDEVAWKGLSGQIGRDEILYAIHHRPRTEQDRENARRSAIGNQNNKGNQWNASSRQKASESQRQRFCDETERMKLSAARQGRTFGPMSSEARQNMRAAASKRYEDPAERAKTAAVAGRKRSENPTPGALANRRFRERMRAAQQAA